MRYDLKVINNMVCETFNGKIINENTFDVINNNESCFIHKSKTGSLSMLNGGALKKLDMNDVNYYYENMDSMIYCVME